MLACLRVQEVANLQVCNLWSDYLPGYGIPGYEGTCGIHVLYRKAPTAQDTGRRWAVLLTRLSTSSCNCSLGSAGWVSPSTQL